MKSMKNMQSMKRNYMRGSLWVGLLCFLLCVGCTEREKEVVPAGEESVESILRSMGQLVTSKPEPLSFVLDTIEELHGYRYLSQEKGISQEGLYAWVRKKCHAKGVLVNDSFPIYENNSSLGIGNILLAQSARTQQFKEVPSLD